MNTSMDEKEFLQYIKEQRKRYESQKAMADAMGITPAYLSDLLNGRRAISETVAQFFGRDRVVSFVEKEPEQS